MSSKPRKTWIAAALLLVGLAAACSKESAAETKQRGTNQAQALPDRDPALAKQLVSEGALLLDVRSQREWDDRHLNGATLIPIDELDGRLAEVDKLTGGDKSKPIVTYCRSGGRSARAKRILLDAGYTRVTNLGGIDDWPN